VRAKEIGAHGAMTALLRDALQPNLVQTLENNPAFVHGGPFANIAHGCNSVLATTTAMKLADYVVTEAGFGADLGAEKFFDIKCRKAGLKPDCAVIVATIRALKMHGGVAKDDLKDENVDALEKGFANLKRHIENVRKFGVPAVVSVNRFITDTDAEMARLLELSEAEGIRCVEATHWADGGAGAEGVARAVVETIETTPSDFKPLYADDMPLLEKVRTIAREIYGADDIQADDAIRKQFAELDQTPAHNFPICMAKTQYSFSTDPSLKAAPSGFNVPIREVRLSAGAEFLVVITGAIMTMPGLPRVPAADRIDVDGEGVISGLF
jgi:formate--tetrahydrofolate ligase